MSVPIHNCSTCRYHDMQDMQMPDGSPVIGKQQMICRRFPPGVVSMQIPTPQGITVSLIGSFPPVTDTVWCHEHEPENGAQDVVA